MDGQVVIVTGSSGAGKTTTCQTFARRADDVYFMFGFDLLVSALVPAKFTPYGERARDFYYHLLNPDIAPGEPRMGFGPAGWRAVNAFHDMIAAAAKAGQRVVVDHLTFLNPPVLQDCIWRLKGVSVLFVALRPPYEVVHERVVNRTFAIPPSVQEALGPNAAQQITEGIKVMTPWIYDAVYQLDRYDLVIDTAACSPDEVCERIEHRLRQGPGTAFEALRRRFPPPQPNA